MWAYGAEKIFGLIRRTCQVAETLLMHGADVNVQDNEGDTPIMAAVSG